VAKRFFPRGVLPQAGDRLANPELGDFLHALGEGDPDSQVASYWASLVDNFGPAQGGLITAQDVAAYAPVIREPLHVPLAPTRYSPTRRRPPAVG
jgi:gamma-glutamyltranspeptidase/glutathione hydrolase